MDLDLLEGALAEAGQPAFRTRQVWSWAARGATGYEAMTDLPAALRAQLADAVPFSTLTLADEAHARRPSLAVPLLAVGLPADLHVLCDRRDALGAHPQRVGDP